MKCFNVGILRVLYRYETSLILSISFSHNLLQFYSNLIAKPRTNTAVE